MPQPKSLPDLPEDYTSKFFTGDVVTKLIDPFFRGRVLRCWADEEGDLPPLPPGVPQHPLDRNLLRGEVGIKNMKGEELLIVPESSLVLFQREFHKGDIVKRSLSKIESAVVLDSKTEVVVERVVSREKVKGWIPYEKLRSSLVIEQRDRVIYDEWIGTVSDVLEDGVVEGASGYSYRIAELDGTMEPGVLVADVLPRHPPCQVPGHNHPPPPPPPTLPPQAEPATDRVVEIRPVIVFVTWHAINQKLPISEQDKHPEPQRTWQGPEIKKLTHFDTTHSTAPALGSTVVFNSEEDLTAYAAASEEGSARLRNVFKIIGSRSRVTLRWQDGTETEDWASELVPYQNIDDYEVWPGDQLVWRGDSGERRPICIQRFNPQQRIADVTFTDDFEASTVSVLELDVGGYGKARYGVGIGHQVLICDDNGMPMPEVPTLGRFEPPMADMMFREEMAQKAEEYQSTGEQVAPVRPEGDKSSIDWYGEVVDLHRDGQIVVKLGNGKMATVGVKNVQLLLNAAEAAEEDEMDMDMEEDMMDDMMPPQAMMMMGQMSGAELNGRDPMAMFQDMMRYGMTHSENGARDDDDMRSDASWETMSGRGEGEEEEQWGQGESKDEEMQLDEEEQDRRDVEEIEPMVAPSSPVDRTSSALSIAGREAQPEAGPSSPRRSPRVVTTNGTADDEDWQKFEMLEEAPEDHHFFKELSNQAGSRAYHSRLAKEHKALRSSLPDNIIVRTYENRTDLLRVLIIGPEGTPYANAPFVFDVYLNPTKFPHEPPVVHFHSHTFGKGRCNPNLYEEGKVCLSILGTWSGDSSESWNPSKSSLLQVFVSISGLVLVKSPYHCEPAFAKLEGTKEGYINSRLYSEKAYVLSRSFVRTALERPPTGLEKEIRHFYLHQGRLEAVIAHARRLIEKGEADAQKGTDGVQDENAEMWNADAIGSLSMGASLTLKRTIVVLEKILAEQATTSQ